MTLTADEQDRLSPYVRPTTDAGNAEVFVDQYGDLVRYDHARQRWLVWDRHRWQPDADKAVNRMALESVRSRQRLALDESLTRDEREKLGLWAIRSESEARQNALLNLARTMLPVADSGQGWDGMPGLVGAPNGVIDLRTGVLRDGQPGDRITKHLGVEYDPTARCQRFGKFLHEVFEDDQEVLRYLKRLVGYTLTAEATHDLVLFLMGIGRNGKSTFLNTLTHVFGDYAHDLPAIALLDERRAAHTTEVADLEATRFVTATEVTDHRLNSGRLKQLSGGDGITARRMRQDNVSFPQTWQLWLSTNHQPRLDDSSVAAWERVKVIPFRQQFLAGAPGTDPGLEQTLRSEAAGILRWAVDGAREFYAESLGPEPQAIREATHEYREDVDPLTTMIEQGYLAEDPEAFTPTTVLYQQGYLRFAEENAVPLDRRFGEDGFAKKLRGRFVTKRVRIDGKKYRGFAGVTAPIPPPPPSPEAQTG